MNIIQTIWASILALGWVKVIIAIIIIGVITKFNKLLGFLAALLFIAHLANWI